MLKSIEVQGKTEDEAIELALEKLGLTRDDVSVEILEMAKPGLFGRKTPAIVKVEYESDDALPQPEEESPSVSAVSATTDTAESSVNESSKSSKKTGSSRSVKEENTGPVDEETLNKVEDYLKGLFEHMGIEASMKISDKDGSVDVDLTADEPGVIIGRRGETLDALQHLTNYSVNRSAAKRTRVYVDIEEYRKRRTESLENLAHRTAAKVAKYRRNVTLDPMNSFERHVIHSALQDNDYVSTFSIGNEMNRRVVIAYGKDAVVKPGFGSRVVTPGYKEWS